ncbi:MAG: 4-(cytidine 5'-diphospho)-2-C-methyl-D-erythritol kinase [Gammaproteobacteria bacterium]|nr:4-(cytidine 5'-diphospho)-2-C-methyl-D-erythritol kinase [Gammaproteobacteria bacterium]
MANSKLTNPESAVWKNKLFPWQAPAKLNLFLHITGRRADGYHLLQTVFHFVDISDTLYFDITENSNISLSPSIENVPDDENIIIKAAKLLQRTTGTKKGAKITLQKRLPMGGGLGGGSSDAATTLLALNKLWGINLNKTDLMALGLSLGADVPIFIYGQTAWAEGVGETLTPLLKAEINPKNWFLIIFPKINVNTSAIFSSSELTRDKLPIRIRDFLNGPTENVFEPVVAKQYPEIQSALNWLNQFSDARLTGTGACIFASFKTEQEAREIAAQAPEKWQSFIAQGCFTTPIEELLHN